MDKKQIEVAQMELAKALENLDVLDAWVYDSLTIRTVQQTQEILVNVYNNILGKALEDDEEETA